MAEVYKKLVEKGLKTLDDVPVTVRDEVKALLEADGFFDEPDAEEDGPGETE